MYGFRAVISSPSCSLITSVRIPHPYILLFQNWHLGVLADIIYVANLSLLAFLNINKGFIFSGIGVFSTNLVAVSMIINQAVSNQIGPGVVYVDVLLALMCLETNVVSIGGHRGRLAFLCSLVISLSVSLNV